jgi:hypothetical protein
LPDRDAIGLKSRQSATFWVYSAADGYRPTPSAGPCDESAGPVVVQSITREVTGLRAVGPGQQRRMTL